MLWPWQRACLGYGSVPMGQRWPWKHACLALEVCPWHGSMHALQTCPLGGPGLGCVPMGLPWQCSDENCVLQYLISITWYQKLRLNLDNNMISKFISKVKTKLGQQWQPSKCLGIWNHQEFFIFLMVFFFTNVIMSFVQASSHPLGCHSSPRWNHKVHSSLPFFYFVNDHVVHIFCTHLINDHSQL